MSKKVAIVVCALPPQGGGIGNNAYYHGKELAKLDYQVEIFTPKYENIKITEIDNCKINYEKVFLGFGKAGFLFSLFRKLKDFDIVHLYYPFFGTDLIILFFKIFNKEKKLILHYEMDPVGEGIMKIIFCLYIKIFLGVLIRATDVVGVLSWDNARNSYLKSYLNKYQSKFVELPNGVDIEIFYPRERDLSIINNFDIREDDKVLIFVGGLDKQHYFKGVEVLLKAFSRLEIENKKLLIVGDGDLRDSYEELSRKLCIKEDVFFSGWIDNKDLPKYYALADVFVLPSTERTESFGIVTAEAQACGLPAVVSDWPGSRMTIVENKTGLLVRPEDEKDLQNKLEVLLNNDELRSKMGETGRKRVLEKYSWDVVIKKIDKIYSNL